MNIIHLKAEQTVYVLSKHSSTFVTVQAKNLPTVMLFIIIHAVPVTYEFVPRRPFCRPGVRPQYWGGVSPCPLGDPPQGPCN